MSQRDDLEMLAGCVLDASALLALLKNEPGEEVVGLLLEISVISSVNWTEVLDRAIAGHMEAPNVRVILEAAGLRILPFTVEDAELTAQLWSISRRAGLSLGDRACLSLAQRLGLPAVTADRAWVDLDLGVEVQLIR